MGAGVIVVLLGLFVYGAATNKAYGWSTYAEYLFNERILFGVLNTLQLTVYAMALGVALGIVLSVMRLSPNPVFQSVAWVFLWIFRGTPVYVQLVFWGLIPTIYQNIQIGVPFGPSLFHFNLQSLSIPFLLAVIGLGLNEAAYMAEIIRAGITSVPEGQSEASTALGMSWGMTMRRTVLPQAMRVIIPPTGNELISMLKTTSLVTAVPYSYDLYSIASARDRRAHLRTGAPAAGRSHLVSGGDEPSHGRPVLSGAVLLQGHLQAADDQATRGSGEGPDRGGPRMTPMVRAEQVCKNFGALPVLKGVTLSVDRGQVLVLVGPSGSGKSTFLRCINHLETVTAGRFTSMVSSWVTARAAASSTRCPRAMPPSSAATSAWCFSTSTYFRTEPPWITSLRRRCM